MKMEEEQYDGSDAVLVLGNVVFNDDFKISDLFILFFCFSGTEKPRG